MQRYNSRRYESARSAGRAAGGSAVGRSRSLSAQTTDLTALTIAEASRRLASGAITPLQLTNAYLSRIAAMNKSLNAYVTVTADLARREARALPDRRRAGSGASRSRTRICSRPEGVRTTAGSLLYDDHIPDDNAAIVQQLEQAGAVMLGKTNTHELGGGVTTINPFFGTTRNPVDPARIAGGSSGGSAAAVVAHLCAAATGSDTGGSVRIPAALLRMRRLQADLRPDQHAGPARREPDLRSRRLPDAHRRRRADHRRASLRETVTRRRASPSRETTSSTTSIPPSPARSVRSSSKYPDIDFPVDAKTMARVFDPIVVFEIWGRLGADWRINPGSFSKDFAGFFSTPRPSIAEYESALAALKEYQAAVDRLFDSRRRHRHADRPRHRAADRRPHRRHEDPPQHLAAQRCRHTGHLDPVENRWITGRHATHR